MTWVMFEAPNLTEIIAKLDGNALLAAPIRKALTRAEELVESRARERAPGGKGHSIESGVTGFVDRRPVPLYAKIPLVSPVKDGFRVAGALEGGPMYHYRTAGPIGRPTQHWFTGSLTGARKDILGFFEDALKEIQASWTKP